MDQKERERILGRFKKKQAMILVATDVAARGIDVNNLTHVINYHIPQDAESYTHRIGRTGRAGNQGIAITFITPAEYRKLAFIKRVTKADIKKEEIPTIESVVKQKKEHVFTQLREAMKEDLGTFTALAKEMEQLGDTENLLPALLKIAFADQLEISRYKEIQEVQSQNTVNRTGKTRLFVARGKSHGYDSKSLIDWIVQETGVSAAEIHDAAVLEEFSFVNCGFEVAEVIIDSFQQKPGRTLVSLSKEKGGSRGGSGGGSSGGARSGGYRGGSG